MIALVLLLAVPTQVPANWECEVAAFGDGVCDCGCDAADSDCASTEFTDCVTNACPAGQAPWEHQNDQCMGSTCGDGWKADDEACDDFNQVASGGCSADCSAVAAGFTCGEAATGCTADAAGEGEGEGEGEPADEGEDDRVETGGCAGASVGLAVALLPLLRRRRR